MPNTIADTKSFKNLAQKLTASEMVTLIYIRLPEFDKNRSIAQQRALIFYNDTCRYDMIIGTNFLSKTDIKLEYESGNMEWYESSLPMRPAYGLYLYKFDTMADMYHIQVKKKIIYKDWLEFFATEILDAKYEWT